MTPEEDCAHDVYSDGETEWCEWCDYTAEMDQPETEDV